MQPRLVRYFDGETVLHMGGTDSAQIDTDAYKKELCIIDSKLSNYFHTIKANLPDRLPRPLPPRRLTIGDVVADNISRLGTDLRNGRTIFSPRTAGDKSLSEQLAIAAVAAVLRFDLWNHPETDFDEYEEVLGRQLADSDAMQHDSY